MSVEIRNPDVSVRLLKNVGRSTIDGKVPVSERFRGRKSSIDLKPFLGEGGSVRVTKSVREPAGSFSLVLTDMVDNDSQDSLYGLIEPMDVIEIRMAANSYKSVGDLPIMMRGFVTEIRRSIAVQNNGQPIRRVLVSGQDYGKIWQIMQIFNMPNAPSGENLITSFPFFARFGVEFQTMLANKFVQEVVDKIINPYIVKMGAQNADEATPLLQLKTNIDNVSGVVIPYGLGGWNNGSIYSLFGTYCDIGIWNELFIEDREDAPYVVYRPNPFITADGSTFIQPLTTEPRFVTVTQNDVVSIEVSRTDANVANYFWVEASRAYIGFDSSLRAFAYTNNADKTFFVDDYGNVNPTLYGTRKMHESTSMGDPQETGSGNGSPAGAQHDQDDQLIISWINGRRKILKEQNKDNVVLENGMIVLKGNEEIKSGRYLRLQHGSMESDYYIVAVTHDFIPFGAYKTTAVVERGTGFVDRVQKGAGTASPYWSEIPDVSK